MFEKLQLQKIMSTLKLQNPHISEAQWAETEARLAERIKNVSPPTIALIGLSGVGKSSTINALFNAGAKVSHHEPCTRVAQPIVGDLYEYTGRKGNIIVYDMPGLGENLMADETHYETYSMVLPNVDVAIWVIDAPSRVISPIEVALRRLRAENGNALVDKIVFAANKIDRIDPGEEAWIRQANVPSKQQQRTIELYERFLRDALKNEVSSAEDSIVCYSAKRRYNLELLLEKVGMHAPDDRAWLLGRVADVADFREFVDPRLLGWIEANRDQLSQFNGRR
ncbi:GTPase family protein [Nocardia xishanensis]